VRHISLRLDVFLVLIGVSRVGATGSDGCRWGSLEPDTLRSIISMRVVAHPLEHGNHWCLYFPGTDGESVRIDPNPDFLWGGGMRALIVVSQLEYLTSWSAEHISILTIAPNLKIQHIIDAITNAGRDRYEFNAAGAGCRKWINDQIQLFFDLGILVDPMEVVSAKNSLLIEYRDKRPTGRRYPLEDGGYY
jgi:hypothetical protein